MWSLRVGHDWATSLSLFTHALEKEMATHFSTLAWRIPWMEEPSGLQSMGSLRVGYDWVTSLSCIGEGNGNPLQCSCLENPRDRGAWWTAVYGVAQSRTLLKRLCSSSSSRWIILHQSTYFTVFGSFLYRFWPQLDCDLLRAWVVLHFAVAEPHTTCGPCLLISTCLCLIIPWQTQSLDLIN